MKMHAAAITCHSSDHSPQLMNANGYFLRCAMRSPVACMVSFSYCSRSEHELGHCAYLVVSRCDLDTVANEEDEGDEEGDD